MILFLRTKENKTVVDIELFEKQNYIELHNVVDIRNYSILLLKNPDKVESIILDFDFLSELRGWLWEKYFMGRQNTNKEFSSVLKEVRRILKLIADKYDLNVVED